MILLINLLLCRNVFLAGDEVITTVYDPWSPVLHISHDTYTSGFIKNNMVHSVGDLESSIGLRSLGEAYELRNMHVHHDDNFFIDVSKQTRFTELPESLGVAKMSMIPSRSHSIFDGGVVVIALNYDLVTNDLCDYVPEATYRGYEVGLCAGSCNYDEASCVGSVATPASQDSCGTCCAGTDGRMRLLPGMMIHDNYHQKIASTTI